MNGSDITSLKTPEIIAEQERLLRLDRELTRSISMREGMCIVIASVASLVLCAQAAWGVMASGWGLVPAVIAINVFMRLVSYRLTKADRLWRSIVREDLLRYTLERVSRIDALG